MEQEIDLRVYAAALARRWRLILAVGLIAALLAAGASLLLPQSYTATATVLLSIRQTGSQLGTNQPLLDIETIDVGSRRIGLVALAKSSAIEAQLPTDILQQATPPQYRPGMLLQQQAIEVTPQGDLLEIAATAATPQQAQLLADAWANTYVAQIQQFYTDGHSQAQVVGNALLPLQPNSSGLASNTLLAGTVGVLLAIMFVIVQQIFGSASEATRPVPQERAVGNPSLSR